MCWLYSISIVVLLGVKDFGKSESSHHIRHKGEWLDKRNTEESKPEGHFVEEATGTLLLSIDANLLLNLHDSQGNYH